MKQYTSLLRGINVGGRNIKMADLKGAYESLGLFDVKAFLQSGNVTFSSNSNNPTALRAKLEETVSSKFKYNAKIFLQSTDTLKNIIDNYPFDRSNNAYQYYVIFTEVGLANLLYEQAKSLNSDLEEIVLGDNVIYWRVQKGMTVKSLFSKLLIKKEFKEFHTNRNIKTLTRLL